MFRLPLKWGLTIFSANSVSNEAGTLWKVRSTRRSSSVAKIAVFFFMCGHSGLPLMAETVKKKSVPTTCQRWGECG